MARRIEWRIGQLLGETSQGARTDLSELSVATVSEDARYEFRLLSTLDLVWDDRDAWARSRGVSNFAETYPSEVEVRNALRTYRSWHARTGAG